MKNLEGRGEMSIPVNNSREAKRFLYLLPVLLIALRPCDASERPNIVFFFADDQTISTLGCYGNKVVQALILMNFIFRRRPSTSLQRLRSVIATDQQTAGDPTHSAMINPAAHNNAWPAADFPCADNSESNRKQDFTFEI